jgi:hypothetical protein
MGINLESTNGIHKGIPKEIKVWVNSESNSGFVTGTRNSIKGIITSLLTD